MGRPRLPLVPDEDSEGAALTGRCAKLEKTNLPYRSYDLIWS
ncbi:hypothetical protein [Myxosarcina sp. GI1(2024)]